MSAALIKMVGPIGKHDHYEVTAYGQTAQLWTLPELAEEAFVDAINELETFSMRRN
jgi:hypothetical protein